MARLLRDSGRQTMTSRLEQGSLVTVFGGSGFVGRHAVEALARDGWRVRAAVRRPDLAGHLQPMGDVGQIDPVQANLRFPDGKLDVLRVAGRAIVNSYLRCLCGAVLGSRTIPYSAFPEPMISSVLSLVSP